MIPDLFHFVYLTGTGQGSRPFGFSHYLAIKSALVVNRPSAVYLHYDQEPAGYWWDQLRPHLRLRPVTAPTTFAGNPLHHVAHQSDIVRLQALHEFGGVYLDTDVLCVRSFRPFYRYPFVMGEQLNPDTAYLSVGSYARRVWEKLRTGRGDIGRLKGLGNAVMMAEPKALFIQHWLDRYCTFRSRGRDEFWSEHSVQKPLELSRQYPWLIQILSGKHFHFPLHDPHGIHLLFETDTPFPQAYAHHLWESYTWGQYLRDLTPERLRFPRTTFARLAWDVWSAPLTDR